MSKQEVYGAEAAYQSARAAFEEFRLEHKDVFEEYDHLTVALKESLEDYKSKLRENAHLFSSQVGGFSISVPRKFSYEELRKSLGDDAEPYTITKYSVNSEMFDKAHKDGKISDAVYDKVVSKDNPRISGGPKVPEIYQP